ELAGEQANIVAMGAHFGSQLSEQVEWLKAGAGERFSSIELSMLFQVLPEGNEQIRQATEQIIKRVYRGQTLESLIAAKAPNLLMGSPEAMAEQLIERRATFGLSYIAVGPFAMEAFAPVVKRLSGQL
ncbi:MAG: hypothetical protein ACREN8_14280, partial [Candidatus Dormibacteraceae bacterium]